MLYLWMNIVPDVEDEDAPLGISTMLSGVDTSSLIRQIDLRLKALGAKIAKHPTVTGSNTEYRILDDTTDPFDPDDVEEHQTGLRLRLYPCDSMGTNVDRDPVEPRGE